MTGKAMAQLAGYKIQKKTVGTALIPINKVSKKVQ